MSGHRKPAHLERIGGKTPRQRIWEAVRTLREGFDNCAVSRKAKVDDKTVSTYLGCLQKAGFIERANLDAPVGIAALWRLARDNGVEAPRLDRKGQPVKQGLGTEQMWRTLRLIGDFSGAELAAHASTEAMLVSPETAKTYVGHLLKAGYLIEVLPARFLGSGKGNLPARYRLAPGKYTGPRPPMVQRTKAIYDPNLDQVVWEEVKRDDDY